MPQIPTIKVLKAARKLVANPKTWTTDTHAADSKGRPCDPCSHKAVKFCAGGAILRSAADCGLSDGDARPLIDALDVIAWRRNGFVGNGLTRHKLTSTNDYVGRKAVLKVMDAAIDELQAGEKK